MFEVIFQVACLTRYEEKLRWMHIGSKSQNTSDIILPNVSVNYFSFS